MDTKFSKDLKPGVRVVVFMGEPLQDILGTPPICTTATAVGVPGEGIPDGNEAFVWLEVDFTSNDEPLPQMYRIKEILGFLLPLAHVTRSADGQTTVGTLPADYVGP